MAVMDGAGVAATAGPTWRRSSFCASGECIEVSGQDGMVLIRDSKLPEAGPLRFSAEEFRAFARAIQSGEFSDLIATAGI